MRTLVPDLEKPLVTKRLVLEPLVPAHAQLLFDDLRDERLFRYHGGRPESVQQLERRFETWRSRASPDGSQIWLNYALKNKNEASYVGWVQATIAGDEALIGYDIFVRYWRQGYAKEACSELIRSLLHDHNAHSIIAVVDTENAASIGLLEALGFERRWTGPSEDMPGRKDHRYELHAGY
jgi:RimJ/RimL family protein N-acetyltransferase